jgi:hypothetical protein
MLDTWVIILIVLVIAVFALNQRVVEGYYPFRSLFYGGYLPRRRYRGRYWPRRRYRERGRGRYWPHSWYSHRNDYGAGNGYGYGNR